MSSRDNSEVSVSAVSSRDNSVSSVSVDALSLDTVLVSSNVNNSSSGASKSLPKVLVSASFNL